MRQNVMWAGVFALATLAGCASGPGSIYVPAGGSAGQQSQTTDERPAGPDALPAEPEAPRQQAPSESKPRYQDESEALSPAAISLIQRAESLLDAGNPTAAIGQLERAQRISPRSAEIYFHLAGAYASMDQYGAGEQFARKGLSLSGSNTRLQRQGWVLMARIRRASGNMAGADQAEARAAAL